MESSQDDEKAKENGLDDEKAKENGLDDEKAKRQAYLRKLWGSDKHPIFSMVEPRGVIGFVKKGEEIDPKRFKTYLPW